MEITKNQVNVHNYYKNKIIFMTGCTGFIGKVLLEKLLWCFPDIKTIYLLIRGKGQVITERFYNNVIKSVCFNRLRNRHGANFNKFIDEKCHIIEGDMTKEKLGLAPEDEQLLINTTQIVINSAASQQYSQRIDFTADLDVNIEINVFGGLRIFDLAKKVKNLENFVQISTAYSNSNIKGEVEEKVYPLNDDPMRLVQEIMSLPKELVLFFLAILKNTKKYLGKFPNTYTFTKNLLEQMLYKEKGKYPIVILRPTIVGAAMREPTKGWTDAISAAGALFLLAGLGLLSFVLGNEDVVLDQIPVDFVVDYLIVAVAVYAKDLSLNVVHCGTSYKNPFKFIWLNDEIWEYWKQNPSTKQAFPPRFYIVTNKLVYKLKNIKRLGESYLYIWFIQRFGNIEQKKQLTRFKKMISREQKVCKEFEYFLTMDFVFKMHNCDVLQNSITQEERDQFLLDPQLIDWKDYLWNFCYGIQIFILKEDVMSPDNISQRNALTQNPLKPRNIENYLMPSQQSQTIKVKEMINHILSKPEIVSQLHGLSQTERKHVEQICKLMFADQNFDYLKRFARPVQKLFKRVFTQIIVDQNKINQLRVLEKSGKNLVIVSNHLSYADFVILTYIFYAYSLKCPFVNSVQDFLGIPLLTQIFRYGGAFFTERKSKHFTQLYSMILSEYMSTLLNQGQNIEFFIENSRTRSGKLTAPNNPTYDLFIETALKHENVDNILIIPVAVTYEKVIEQDAFTFELLGEEKPQEGIWRLLKWMTNSITDCGRVYLGIGEPVEIKQFYNKSEITHQPLMNSIANLQIITPNSMVASIILMSRKGISSETLTNQCDWLSHQLQKRQLKIASISQSSPLISVPKAISYFDDILIKNKEVFSLAVKPKEEYKAILLLAYYRNALLNQLFKEAKASCALMALVAINQAIVQTEFTLLYFTGKENFILGFSILK